MNVCIGTTIQLTTGIISAILHFTDGRILPSQGMISTMEKKTKQKRDTGRCQARGGVPISNRVVRGGLPDNMTLTKELQK